MALFTVIVLLILLVIGDRVALAVTENQFADQFQKQGFPVKPSVTIEGFPFLTQLLGKDFNKVDISASNVPVPLPTGGSISISSVHATINGLHISGFSSSANAKVDHITATAFVSFGALAAAGGIGGGSGITVTPDGANKVKITRGPRRDLLRHRGSADHADRAADDQHQGAAEQQSGRLAAQLVRVLLVQPAQGRARQPQDHRPDPQLPGPHRLGGCL